MVHAKKSPSIEWNHESKYVDLFFLLPPVSFCCYYGGRTEDATWLDETPILRTRPLESYKKINLHYRNLPKQLLNSVRNKVIHRQVWQTWLEVRPYH